MKFMILLDFECLEVVLFQLSEVFQKWKMLKWRCINWIRTSSGESVLCFGDLASGLNI